MAFLGVFTAITILVQESHSDAPFDHLSFLLGFVILEEYLLDFDIQILKNFWNLHLILHFQLLEIENLHLMGQHSGFFLRIWPFLNSPTPPSAFIRGRNHFCKYRGLKLWIEF